MSDSINSVNDIDPIETKEWLDSIDSLIGREGSERAEFLIQKLTKHIGGSADIFGRNTPYLNTIAKKDEAPFPGKKKLEEKITNIIRWNAMAMVMKANKTTSELGGHIASYGSSAILFETGFNHFWKGINGEKQGDLVFFQGHISPGMYARAYLEGRLTDEHLNNFRQEITGEGKALSSYPHPWLMPDFWQFPTVSMGLGPLMAIYQARFMKYLEHRGLIEPSDRKVWCFIGDGETDEPETLGSIALAVRESLDNLIFVVNCNLQRLDGPVRGNGKIIQELEANFRGNGWNVIKLLWSSDWDALLEDDDTGLLRQRMEEAVDGEYQSYKVKGGEYTREEFFGKYEELKAMVADMSDEDIANLRRGGHDMEKVYAAYHKATTTKGLPTVILAKTVKGYGMGGSGLGLNNTHSIKKMAKEDLISFRDKFDIQLTDEQILNYEFYKPAENSEEMQYMKARRADLGGHVPSRPTEHPVLQTPDLDSLGALLKSTEGREISTTMAIVRIMSSLVRDKNSGKNIVPIVPDEARTFGMEGMFRQVGIYAPEGQKYTPYDSDQLMWYKEAANGQVLQEGINEAGAMCDWIAAGTSYANNGVPMIPFYIYYSMFGFQRIGDFAWAAGDIQAKGFLIGATAGRTTLAGEGLQHQDGHSHVMAHTIPNCVSYDPTFSYELAVIIIEGMRRMYMQNESVFYYVTTMNENYAHPAMPEGDHIREGIVKGLYPLSSTAKKPNHVQLVGAGTILNEVIQASDILEADYDISSEVWSAPSVNELRRDGEDCSRWNLMNPTETPRKPYVSECFEAKEGPIVMATDYIKLHTDSIRPYLGGKTFVNLGTDGFGRSDTRKALRSHFEVDAVHIVYATLSTLYTEGKISGDVLNKAKNDLGINPAKPNPVSK